MKHGWPALVARVRRAYNSPYREIVFGAFSMIVLVISLPRMWTVTSNAPLILGSAYTLLCFDRYLRLKSKVDSHATPRRVTRAERARVFTRPMALIAIIGTILSSAADTTERVSKVMTASALSRHDQGDYLKWQVWHALVTAPVELKQAEFLAQGVNDRGAQPGPDCSAEFRSKREGLIIDVRLPDIHRVDLLRADALCAQRDQDEITVVHDVATIHRFPFDLLDPRIAAVEDLCFGMRDYGGCILAARNAGSVGRRELILIRDHSRDQRLRHAINLGLAT